jgi:hypothetical protein
VPVSFCRFDPIIGLNDQLFEKSANKKTASSNEAVF